MRSIWNNPKEILFYKLSLDYKLQKLKTILTFFDPLGVFYLKTDLPILNINQGYFTKFKANTMIMIYDVFLAARVSSTKTMSLVFFTQAIL